MLAIVLAAWSAAGASAMVYGEAGYETEGYDEDSAWEINSVATLIKARDDINDGTISMGRYYKLAEDLDITSYTDWIPIGLSSTYPFRGHFDGNGHTITVKIARSDEEYAGLFGYIYGGEICNLSVNGSVRLATVNKSISIYAGGIAACVSRGTIDSCNFDGKVNLSGANRDDYQYAGGIAGYVSSGFGTNSTITNNSTGKNDASTAVKALFSISDNPNTYAGGIIGKVRVYNEDSSDGVTITGNYSRLKTQAGHTDTLTYGNLDKSYGYIYQNKILVYDNKEYDPEDYPDPEPTITAPTITTSSLSNATAGQSYSATLAATGSSPITWSVYSGSLPSGLTLSSSGVISGTPAAAGTYTFTVKASNSGGDATKTFTLVIASGSTSRKYGSEGHGDSEDDAWEIDSLETLKKFRDDINNGAESEGKYYKLTDDIDLTGETDWVAIGNSFSDSNFRGHFDGGGHTIKINLRKSEYIVGVFGYVIGGTVKNLSVEGNISVTSDSDVRAGGVISTIRGGSVENCSFDGSITISATDDAGHWFHAGGIVAVALNEVVSITNCSVGQNDASTVIKVQGGSSESISGYKTTYAGGIISYIDDADSSTTVTGNYTRAATSAEYTETLTCGRRYYGNGTFYNNVEVPVSDGSSSKKYGEGEHGDSENDAWEIDSVETLMKLRDDVNSGSVASGKYFKLTADLDISGYTDWAPIGTNSRTPFSGYFNGNGHTVTLNISNSTLSYVGLFGYVSGGTIQNLSVEGTVKADYGTSIYVGGIIGHITGGTINNCRFDGTVSTNPGDYSTIGGIVGFARSDSGLNITNNSVGRKDTSSVVEALPVEKVAYAGGIVGFIAGEGDAIVVTGNYSRLKTQAKYTKTLTYGTDYECGNGTFANNIEIDTSGTLATPPVITTGSGLGTFKKGDSVSVQLEASGTTPLTWSITAGSLPTGLTMSSTGLISGTLTATGTFTFTVYASNSAGLTSSTFSMTVTSSTSGTHRYQLFNESMTWTEAKAYCENLGGHLATITSQSEHDEVMKLVPQNERRIYWLGGFRKSTSSAWEWVTGEAFSFTNWHSGEPNNAWGDECYLELSSYQYDGSWGWNDENNTSYNASVTGFICEWDENEPEVIAPTITVTGLPDGVKGESYSAQLSADGTSPILWNIEGLPDGLSANSEGLISGTPSTVGSFLPIATAGNSAGKDTRTYKIVITEPAPTVIAPVITTTQDLGTFTVGDSVSVNLEATGTTPITWLKTDGSLPDGLTLSTSGEISGELTKAGTFSFLVSATNTAGSVSRRFTMKVSALKPSVIAPVITSSGDLGKFMAGDKLGVQLKATGTSPITWTATGLPEGLSISSAGLIYGTAMTAWQYTFTVTASNSAGSDSRQFTLTFEDAVIAPKITTAQDLGTFTVGNSMSKLIEATGSSPLTWNAMGLPSWLTLNADTGMIFGTPEKAGEFSFTLTAENSGGKDSRKFLLKVKTNASTATAPTITTGSLPDGETGAVYNTTLDAKGTSPLTWSASGLPDGLTLNETSGKLAGSPKASGTFTIVVTVENSAGNDTREYSLTIAEKNKLNAPKITTERMTDATEGTAYAFQFEAEGSNVTWTATWKTLTGLTLTPDGVLRGTPERSGTYNITVKAKNAAGTDYANLTLRVNSANGNAKAPTVKSSKIPDAYQDEDYSYFLEAEGSSPMTWKLEDPNSLPKGLELTEDGEITGKVDTSKATTFKFNVIATNSVSSNKKQITLKVLAKALTFKSDALKEAKWNKKYSFTVKVQNMKPTVWSIEGELPDGVKFDKGKFSGKPMEVGEFELTITAGNGAVELSDEFTLNVKGITPKIKGSFKKGTEGEPYRSVLKAKGVTPMTWDFEDLPDGLDYTTNATGEECTITGTPQGAFNGKITVTVENGSGDDETSVSRGLKMTIKAVKPKITTTINDIPDGTVGERYFCQLKYSPETAEVVWSYTGDMPEGLTLDEDTGIISGVPEKAVKNAKLKITVSNVNKASYKSTQTLYITIKAADADTEEPEIPAFENGIAIYERGELTTETLATIAHNDEVIAAILPALEVEEEGLYEFNVSLDVNVPVDGRLVWHSFPDGEDDENDEENAVFLDEAGETIERVPETYTVTVSAWLKPGVIYEPVIAVKLHE